MGNGGSEPAEIAVESPRSELRPEETDAPPWFFASFCFVASAAARGRLPLEAYEEHLCLPQAGYVKGMLILT
jgi:hypothetical protein